MDQQNEGEMMDDRELLKMAARAAGYKGQWDKDWWAMCDVESHWDPLRHNGQALRLAVKLGLLVSQQLSYVSVSQPHGGNASSGICWTTSYDGDPYAATRRAIVRAAAELARAGAQKG